VSGAGRMDDQALGVTHIGEVAPQPQRLDEPLPGSPPAAGTSPK